MNLSDQYRRDEELNARITILKAVYEQTDRRLNDILIQKQLDLFGHRKSRDWLRTQLRAMSELGVISIREIGSAMVAEITQTGVDHCECRMIVEGIARPSASQ
ncbi:putative phage related protein [Roseibium sp. TrichSKD4]|uniref:VpaChn25_0724 family phage protein n=1 Tax=Roseibium sp. TrichSKD4 TaxID=744980 RepID=UPI0001E56D2A|nr:hypothetical protein [Roseibium sp. TrichSKD4]EFO33235.1 putative phage related protein [Roseibium sp. TrichSKD4]